MSKNIIIIIAGLIIGAGAGFAYWYFIGCNTGTCPITANWYSSTGYGLLMGGLLGGLVKDFAKPKKEEPAP